MKTFNLGHFLTQNAIRYPQKVGLISGSDHYTWLQLNEAVDRVASAMASAGIGAGDRVLVQARNDMASFEVKWACFKLGAVWTPLNFRLSPAEVATIAASAKPSAIFFHREFEPHCRRAVEACASVKITVGLDGATPLGPAFASFIQSASGEFTEAEVESNDPAWLFYTSGTTGRPKGALLTHGQLAFVVATHLSDAFPGMCADDVTMIITPLSHGAGMHSIATIARGATQFVLPSGSLDPENVWQAVEAHRVSNFFAVPTLVKALVEHPAVDRYDHSSLRYVNYGGAPMYRFDQQKALAKLGPVLVQHYGLGEFTASISVLTREQHEAESRGAEVGTGSCGMPRTGIEVAILDETGQRQPTGAVGEICARGEAAFLGYFENEEATRQAFRGGWFHTGDVGFLDSRGYLHITGRLSDMFISGGINIHPREIEEVLLEDGRYSEVAVVGIPSEKWGEEGVAVLVVKPEFCTPISEPLRSLKDRLASYKHPKRIVFMESLPKSAYGKILKRDLIRQLEASVPSGANQ